MRRYTQPFAPVRSVKRRSSVPLRLYSVTADILSFRRCARQYGNEAVHGYQASRTSQFFYGTVIHQVLDRAHSHFQGLMDPAAKGELPTDEDIGSYFADVVQSLRTQGIRGARPQVEEQALKVLQLFNQIEGPDLYPRVIDTEHRMQANEESYVLRGTVDLLVAAHGPNRHPTALEIWDYKGQRRPGPKDFRLIDYRFQMLVYSELYRRRHGFLPARAQLYFMNELLADTRPVEESRRQALLTVDVEEAEVELALKSFRASVGSIEECRRADAWPAPDVGRGPGEDTCVICDFRWNCPTVRGDAGLSARIPIRYP